MILLFGPGHRLVERALVDAGRTLSCALSCFVGVAAARLLFDLDARPVGQHGQGLGEIDAFHLHHEAENVAADVAHPALQALPLRIDLQTGPGVVVPRAEGHETAALPAQLQVVLAEQIDDIDRLPDLFLGVEGRVEGHRRLPKF